MFKHVETFDPEIYAAIKGEIDRENNTFELIASENYTSEAVMQAQGSILTNKYAEGLPHKRYYGGNEYSMKETVFFNMTIFFKSHHPPASIAPKR